MSDALHIEQIGRVLAIQFINEKKLNALDSALANRLRDIAVAADDNPNIGCLLLTGKGRAFAAGADIEELRAHDARSMYQDNVFAAWDSFARTRLPKVAAVNGYALGGGCELAMMCDVILAGQSAKFGQPEIKIGCFPGMGGTQRLTRLVGRAVAMDLILTGRMITAQEAQGFGLVSRVISDDDLASEAMATATMIAGYSRDVAMMARQCVNEAEETNLAAGVRYERQMYHSVYGHKDQCEGMDAFLAKRSPVFNRES